MPPTYDPRYDNPLGPMGESTAQPHPRPSPSSGGGHSEPPQSDVYDYAQHGGSASYLGQLPLPAGREDTESALKTLFGEQGGQDVHDEGVDAGGHGGVQTLAAQEQAEQAREHHAHSQHSENGEGLPVPRYLTPDVGSASGSGMEGPPAGSQKRKATSRAGMLARGGACEFCKRRKLKCSAELPQCANCEKAGKECVYAQKRQRSRVKILEDRLQELEKKLGTEAQGAGAGEASGEHPGVQVEAAAEVQHHFDISIDPSLDAPINQGVYDSLASFDLGLAPHKRLDQEPDLMTLADAAAADMSVEAPWERLSPEEVANEIVRVVGGGKGMGEKIIAHLISIYINPTSLPFLHSAIRPQDVLSRLSPASPSPLHPALLLSLISFLLPLSPSPALHSPTIPALLLPHARAHSTHAIAITDPRILDIITSGILRAYSFYGQSRNLEGWVDSAAANGLVRAAGLGKLGGAGERFLPFELEGRAERAERERKMRVALHKGVVVPPPQNPRELGDMINLFWNAYLNDRTAAIGWGWPSALSDDEITTPWPKEDYEDPAALKDTSTIHTFLSATTADKPSTPDGPLCATVKAITLLYHSQRLFDLAPGVATPERTYQLIRLTRSYMSTLGRVRQEAWGETGILEGMFNQVWMVLYTALAFLHAKEEVDATPGSERDHLEQSIEAAGKVLEHVQIAQLNGDATINTGYDITSSVCFLLLGRLMIKYADRLLAHPQPNEEARLLDLRNKADAFKSALAAQAATHKPGMRFARVGVQVLENAQVGVEWKEGEWERADGLDW
ncbi:hypothetical protein IAT38_004306 [Cryptococcus sp. DSM 104549]